MPLYNEWRRWFLAGKQASFSCLRFQPQPTTTTTTASQMLHSANCGHYFKGRLAGWLAEWVSGSPFIWLASIQTSIQNVGKSRSGVKAVEFNSFQLFIFSPSELWTAFSLRSSVYPQQGPSEFNPSPTPPRHDSWYFSKDEDGNFVWERIHQNKESYIWLPLPLHSQSAPKTFTLSRTKEREERNFIVSSKVQSVWGGKPNF